jgi:hypothetical protein
MLERILVAIAFLVLVCPSGRASDGPMDRATLRGLKAVRVIVDPPDAELQRAGVTATKLAAQISQIVTKAGLTVDNQAIEFVGLHVTAAHAKKKSSAVCLTLGLYQNVALARDATIKTTTETWSGESVVLAPPELFTDAVADTVSQLVDQFIEAFRSANPSAQGSSPR